MARWARVAVSLAIVDGIVIVGTAAWISHFGAVAQPKPSDCILILGCGSYGSSPSPFLRDRLERGLQLYRDGYGAKIIVSGGQGPGETITEAEAMQRYLVSKGVPPADIIIEGRSTSTATNLRYSLEKMREHSLQSAVIVSNRFHLARAAILATRLGLDATFPGTYAPEYWAAETAGLLREVAAVWWALATVHGNSP
ncbi:MAG: YdcF family protein [Limnochordales bacterium]|nr:YdcF family protein [Limnochordales bacterium]